MRMTEKQYAAHLKQQRQPRQNEGKTRTSREDILDALGKRLQTEYGDAFERVGYRFWNDEACVYITIDDWLCWSNNDEDGHIYTPWRRIPFTSDGLQNKGAIDKAMARIISTITAATSPKNKPGF